MFLVLLLLSKYLLARRCFLLHQPGSDGGQPVGDSVHHQHPVQLQPVQCGASLAQRAGAALHCPRGLPASKEKERQGHGLPQPLYQRYAAVGSGRRRTK